MISVLQAEQIHNVLIDEFGGSKGVRDYGMLSSALLRPLQTFDGKELYPSILEKAASLLESILINHPFIDGNKRIGYVLMRLYLLENGYDIEATQQNKYNFVMSVASGQKRYDAIIHWLEEYVTKKNGR